MRTFLAGEEGVCSGVGDGVPDYRGEIEGEGDSFTVGEGIGVGDSCAATIWTKGTETTQASKVTIRNLSIVAPVHVWKNVVLPLAVAQKFFIEIICNKLIVQTVEASKVIDRALGRVFARSPGFHQKCPVT